MFQNIKKAFARVSPFKEAGSSGTAIFGGYISVEEKNPKATGAERYRTASDMLANISIIAAGVRYFLNLVAKPAWIVEPADDSDEAKQHAEFIESVMNGMDVGWSRVVRRAGMYRYHGFGIQEWVALKREDGLIGLRTIEQRPQHTIERWEVDEDGTLLGVWQRSPQTGQDLWLPREKIVYMVDDMLTDSPEGMGWFRHLIEPAQRLKSYLDLEAMGFERDLSGIPIGRAPIAALNTAVKNNVMTQQQADAAINGLRRFVQMEIRKKNTGMILDSQHFNDTTADGPKASAVAQWGIELLTGSSGSLPQLSAAIERLTVEMARIMGVENILVGSGGDGSLALSKDKSNNLYLLVNSTLVDMAGQFNKDIVDTLWALNGLPAEMKPSLKTEDVAFRDVEQVAKALADMATAGAVLAPDDPAVDDVRDLLGIARPVKPEMM